VGRRRHDGWVSRLNAHRQLPLGHSPINARVNVRMSPRSCRTTTSCFGPFGDIVECCSLTIISDRWHSGEPNGCGNKTG
jgi:hypothetical protein